MGRQAQARSPPLPSRTLYSPAPISAVTGLVIAILALAGAPLISRVTC